MEIPKPGPEHQWLQRLIGQWNFEHECQMGPDQPPVNSSGSQTTRSLGELWIISDMIGDMPGGGSAQSIMTLGFDPAAGRFVGTFVSSCMTHLWPYNGTLDAAGKVLTLDSEGPGFSGDGTMSKYQDIIEIIDENHHTMASQFLGPDGQWVRFMLGHYHRSSSS